MKSFSIRLLLAAFCIAGVSGAASSSLDALRWRRRVLLVASPSPTDPAAVRQRGILAGWRGGASDRDLSLVEVSGSTVTGVSDPAADLRRRYRLASSAFQALLIGKDGHVVLRSARPIDANVLQGMIDAMPMRRAGER